MKKIKELLVKVSAMGASVLALPSKAMAAAWFSNPIDADNLNDLIRTVLRTAIVGSAIIAVVYLIYNGIKYMVSGGDATKTEEAQKGLANAIIGLVVCLAAYLIVEFITGMLGYDLAGL